MKNRSSYIKIIVISSILLLTLFLVTLFSLLQIINHKDDKPVKEKIIVNYNLENIDNLVFDFKRADVVFKASNEDELVVIQNTKEEKLFLNINNVGNKIYIEEESYLFEGKDRKYTIKVPKNYEGTININNGFGELDIYNIKSKIELDNNSGEINVFKCENINIKDISGSLNLKDITGDINLSSSTGDININGIKGSLKIDTLAGEVIVKNFKIDGKSKIENITGNISVLISEESVCKLKYYNENGENIINKGKCKDKKNILEIKNISGNINIK